MNHENVTPTIVRMADVISTTKLSRATIYRLMNTGDFPQHFKLGSSAVGWLASDVHSWILARAKPNAISAPPESGKTLH